MSDIKTGDVVQLRSGSPLFTVVSVKRTNVGGFFSAMPMLIEIVSMRRYDYGKEEFINAQMRAEVLEVVPTKRS